MNRLNHKFEFNNRVKSGLGNARPMNRQGQKGAVLIVSLMVLLILTLLAMSSSQTITLQEKMTAAVRDGHLALEQAEATLKAAENYVSTTIVSPDQFQDKGGLFLGYEDTLKGKSTVVTIDVTDETWWSDANNYMTVTNDDGEVKGKYTIAYGGPMSEDGKQYGVILCDYSTCNDEKLEGVDAFNIYVRGEGRDSGVRYIEGQYAKKM